MTYTGGGGSSPLGTELTWLDSLLSLFGLMRIPNGDVFEHPVTREYWITVERCNESH